MIKISKLAGLVATSIALAPRVASAMPIAPQNNYGRSRGNFTETVQWRICRAVRQEWAARFGWRTWRYFRCVARRGCA